MNIYIRFGQWERFANRLFITGYHLCNKYNNNDILCFNLEDKNVCKILDYNNIKHKIDKDMSNYDEFKYYQDYILFDKTKLQKYFKCPIDIRNAIFKEIPNINDSIVIHVRRGDYLLETNFFISLSQDQYKDIFDKYNLYDENIVIISDDINWCENNINFSPNIYFSHNDILFDFYCLSFSKYNICSCSSFSMMGSYLNTSNNHIVPYPYINTDNINELNEFELIVPNKYIRYKLT